MKSPRLSYEGMHHDWPRMLGVAEFGFLMAVDTDTSDLKPDEDRITEPDEDEKFQVIILTTDDVDRDKEGAEGQQTATYLLPPSVGPDLWMKLTDFLLAYDDDAMGNMLGHLLKHMIMSAVKDGTNPPPEVADEMPGLLELLEVLRKGQDPDES